MEEQQFPSPLQRGSLPALSSPLRCQLLVLSYSSSTDGAAGQVPLACVWGIASQRNVSHTAAPGQAWWGGRPPPGHHCCVPLNTSTIGAAQLDSRLTPTLGAPCAQIYSQFPPQLVFIREEGWEKPARAPSGVPGPQCPLGPRAPRPPTLLSPWQLVSRLLGLRSGSAIHLCLEFSLAGRWPGLCRLGAPPCCPRRGGASAGTGADPVLLASP